jgi:hypothetical protein
MEGTAGSPLDELEGVTMKRMFWLALGVTVGALVVRKLSSAAESLTPRGLSGSLRGLSESLRDLVEEIREGAAERESELLEGTGMDGRLGARPEDFR